MTTSLPVEIIFQRLCKMGVPAGCIVKDLEAQACTVGSTAVFVLEHGQVLFCFQDAGADALMTDAVPYGVVRSLEDIALLALQGPQMQQAQAA